MTASTDADSVESTIEPVATTEVEAPAFTERCLPSPYCGCPCHTPGMQTSHVVACCYGGVLPSTQPFWLGEPQCET